MDGYRMDRELISRFSIAKILKCQHVPSAAKRAIVLRVKRSRCPLLDDITKDKNILTIGFRSGFTN